MMSTIAALALIAAGQGSLKTCTPPNAAALMVDIATMESGLNPLAIKDNHSGRSYYPDTLDQAVTIARSLVAIGHINLDLGIAQVNLKVNGAWTGLTSPERPYEVTERVFNACLNFQAGAKVLLVRYNGDPKGAEKERYYQRIVRAGQATVGEPPPPKATPPPELQASVISRPGRGRSISY